MAEHDDETTMEYTPSEAPEFIKSLVYLFSDNAAELQQLAKTLDGYNHETQTFNALEELHSAIELREPKALVIDIDSDNGKALSTSLANAENIFFPVIYLSSNDVFEDRLKALRAGAAGYYIKPFDVGSLSLKIDERVAQSEVSGYRILVVDDDETLTYYYDAVLSSAEMHVMALTDPSQVLDKMKTFKPELLLLDINMPICSGIELAQIIRQNNHYLDIPIVFLTSDADKQLRAIETGADDFLNKPIDPEILISAISNRAARYRAMRKSR